MNIQVDIVPMILAFAGIIVYAVRIEGRVNYIEKANKETQKDVDELRIKHENLDSKLLNKISDLEKTLARIEGSLSYLHTKEKE